jgi:acyl-CoA-binding protein
MARRREEESSLSGYEHEFLRASEELKTAALRNEVYLSDAQKIKFYALFKQATDGDCTKPQPSAYLSFSQWWLCF